MNRNFDFRAHDIYQNVYPEFLISLGQKYDLSYCAFGDIFREDMKSYRQDICLEVGLQPLLPIFGWDEEEILNQFINAGFKGIIKVIDTLRVPPHLLGKPIDYSLIKMLKEMDISLCGENGEYHTFVYDGPIFTKPVTFQMGEPMNIDTNLIVELF